MIGRRAILQGLLGMAAAPAIGKEAIANALKVPVPPVPVADDFGPAAEVAPPSPMRRLAWRTIRKLQDRREMHYQVKNYMPVEISSKRSWSPAFKEHEFVREYLDEQELIRRMQEDEEWAEKVLSAMGVHL